MNDLVYITSRDLPIGTRFKVDMTGTIFEVVETKGNNNCKDCILRDDKHSMSCLYFPVLCTNRKDGKDVHFVAVE